jgi:hypothetical protein
MPLPPVDQLHPVIRALHDYWRGIHPASGLPGRQHFNPADIPRLLANVWLVDVHTDPYRFKYRVLGSALIEAGTPVRTGKFLDEAIPEPDKRARMESFFIQAIESRAPNWRRGEPTIYHNRFIAELEVIALPLARDGTTVDQLLCATYFYWKKP